MFISNVLNCRLLYFAHCFQDDSVEAELIRNHHSTAGKSSPQTIDDNNTADDNANNDSSQKDKFGEDSLDGADIYDVTVGDVIYDVLLTLRDHPDIVKQLIASKYTWTSPRLYFLAF